MLTEAEALFLAPPIHNGPPTVCDRTGCLQSARTRIPGAALCDECWKQLGQADSDGCYSIPIDELVGGEGWRDARNAEYVETLRDQLRARPRLLRACHVEDLDLLAGRFVDQFTAA